MEKLFQRGLEISHHSRKYTFAYTFVDEQWRRTWTGHTIFERITR